MMSSPLAKKCVHVAVPDRGEVTPASCKTGPSHGTTCRFSCRDGFQVDKTEATCSDGFWSVNPNFVCVGKS